MDHLKEIIADIKSKAELKSVPNKIINNILSKHITNKFRQKCTNESKFSRLKKSKEYKEIVKKVRAELRMRYGMFKAANASKVQKILNKIKKAIENSDYDQIVELHKDLLKTHRSTKERLPHYPEVYEKIFKIASPKSILDLGCGLNPISVIYMPHYPKIYARELTSEDVNSLKSYYQMMGMKGTVKQADLLEEKSFPKADVVFLFKIIDVLEHTKKGIALRLIKSLKAKGIIISFATKTLGGKPMRTKRTWFLNMLKYNNIKYTSFSIPNEIFYIIYSK